MSISGVGAFRGPGSVAGGRPVRTRNRPATAGLHTDSYQGTAASPARTVAASSKTGEARTIAMDGWRLVLDLSVFDHCQSILQLSAGRDMSMRNRFGARAVRAEYRAGPGVDSVVDNTRPFPCKDNTYDGISIRKGLCDCHGSGTTCGGIPLTEAAATSFLLEVARALDKGNPESVAVLHGSHFTGPVRGEAALQLWEKAARNAAKTAGVDVYVLRPPRSVPSPFSGIIIRPAGSPVLPGPAAATHTSGLR